MTGSFDGRRVGSRAQGAGAESDGRLSSLSLGRSRSVRRSLRLAASASIAALAFASSSPVAHAYCRMTTATIPATYNPARGCFTEGHPLFWRNACVGYNLNRAASVDVPLDVATSVVDQAFGTWAGVLCSGTHVGISPSNLGPTDVSEVAFNDGAPNQNVIVFRDEEWPYSDPNNTLGLTTVTFVPSTGEIYDADMEINATGHSLSTSDKVPPTGYDLLSVITHEAGHFLGLAHATSPSSTMYASYKPGSSSLRDLSDDDVAGICSIYPNAAERNVDTSVSSSGTIRATACDPTIQHSTSQSEADGASDSSSCSVSAAGIGGRSAASHGSRSAGGSTTGFLASLFVAAFGWFARNARRREGEPREDRSVNRDA